MRDTELRRERDREIYRTYLRGLREEHFCNMREAAAWIRRQPAPKYYMSAKSLVNYIGIIQRGGTLENLHPSTREKVFHLYDMYRRYLREQPVTMHTTRLEICEILVDQPAPCFYLTPNTTRRMLAYVRARRRKNIM